MFCFMVEFTLLNFGRRAISNAVIVLYCIATTKCMSGLADIYVCVYVSFCLNCFLEESD